MFTLFFVYSVAVQFGYLSLHSYDLSRSYLHLSIREYAEMVRKHETIRLSCTVISRYGSWLYKTEVSFFLKCLYSIIILHKKENSFNKLIHTIQIFMRKYFIVQHYPRNIFNIELFPNYGKSIYWGMPHLMVSLLNLNFIKPSTLKVI